MPVEIGDHDVRALNTGTNYAMFAIWAITRHLNVARAVKPHMAYLFLTQKYKTVSVQRKTFQNALSAKGSSKWFGRNPEGSYYLKKPAEREVESWIERGKVEQTAD